MDTEKEEGTTHVHHDITYSLNSEGRCGWYSCTHNMYNGDEPEKINGETTWYGHALERERDTPVSGW